MSKSSTASPNSSESSFSKNDNKSVSQKREESLNDISDQGSETSETASDDDSSQNSDVLETKSNSSEASDDQEAWEKESFSSEDSRGEMSADPQASSLTEINLKKHIKRGESEVSEHPQLILDEEISSQRSLDVKRNSNSREVRSGIFNRGSAETSKGLTKFDDRTSLYKKPPEQTEYDDETSSKRSSTEYLLGAATLGNSSKQPNDQTFYQPSSGGNDPFGGVKTKYNPNPNPANLHSEDHQFLTNDSSSIPLATETETDKNPKTVVRSTQTEAAKVDKSTQTDEDFDEIQISVSELQKDYGYSGKYTEILDENNRQNASYIFQLKGSGSKTPITLYRNSGSFVVNYKSEGEKPAIKILNDHLDDARGFARYRNPSMTMVKVEKSDKSIEHHLVFSSPQHGISTKIVSESAFKQILKESEVEFQKSLEAEARLDILHHNGFSLGGEYQKLRENPNYLDDPEKCRFVRMLKNAENSLNGNSTKAWTDWKKSEKALNIFESEVDFLKIIKAVNNPNYPNANFRDRQLEIYFDNIFTKYANKIDEAGLVVSEKDHIKRKDMKDPFLAFINKIAKDPNLLNYDNSTLSESGRKECLEMLKEFFPTRSEAVEELLNYTLPGQKDFFTKEKLDEQIKKITPERKNELRTRASYKEVDEDLKCVDLGYSEREKNIIKNSNIYYEDFDLRGKKKERFDHFLNNVDGWTGRYDGLSYRRSEGDENIATVTFKGLKGGEGPYDGEKISYIEVRGTEPGTKYYVKVELASANADYPVYDSGKFKTEKHKAGDLIFDKSTVFYIDKNGKYQPKSVSELSDHNKKRYETLSVSAISMIGGERKTAVLFEGRTTPCVTLAKVEKAIDEKATDNENKFDSILPLGKEFDLVVKMKRGNDKKWYPENTHTIYLRNLLDKDADLKEVPFGANRSFFSSEQSKLEHGNDKELLDFLEKNGVKKVHLQVNAPPMKDRTKSRELCKALEDTLAKKTLDGITPKLSFVPISCYPLTKGREARKILQPNESDSEQRTKSTIKANDGVKSTIKDNDGVKSTKDTHSKHRNKIMGKYTKKVAEKLPDVLGAVGSFLRLY